MILPARQSLPVALSHAPATSIGSSQYPLQQMGYGVLSGPKHFLSMSLVLTPSCPKSLLPHE
eukprot:CAMPEP_0173411400 /NCGR_PEP_ID=MMETSP1356-20130122/76870_1 /TAXON_ID=77927 ORGANISM="Hemiselmis virescens, Strain PCC157" /NCGR_SAMPLE_ID=MMETSP1356 /ASSEMBLY_ACC=CAM_ASM_000847 /LENGTH=61 /DNA_ID=CAMNT_0014373153 /DNA_START=159 /DNA_END=344 /DNA_ORIENTATION=+